MKKKLGIVGNSKKYILALSLIPNKELLKPPIIS